VGYTNTEESKLLSLHLEPHVGRHGRHFNLTLANKAERKRKTEKEKVEQGKRKKETERERTRARRRKRARESERESKRERGRDREKEGKTWAVYAGRKLVRQRTR